VVLVGHSTGTGEVTRYLGSYGSARAAKGVLVAPIPPCLLQTGDNPEGVPRSVLDGFVQAAQADAPAWMKASLDNFYNIDTLRGTLVSDQACQASWNVAAAVVGHRHGGLHPDLDDRFPLRPGQDRRPGAGRAG
jgi:non-heme chloroperoxidase